MLLYTSVYFLFLAGVYFFYWPLTKLRTAALAVVLFANYFFYAKWGLFYLALVPTASTLDFLIGLGLGRAQRTWARRALLSVSVLLNVGLLALLKYMPFFLENYARITGLQAPAWDWTFPLGISFYTFQALTYTIDIYRRDAKPTSSLLAYLASVSFFPTTLAGPITRVASLLPQWEKKDRSLSATDGGRALFLISLGLIKKLLIADFLADHLVNRVFDFPNLYSGFETLVGVYGYAWQLYYDFSGYTDIAIGSALLLGIKLPLNFNQPYLAENIADFWRRWHISLSNWLRDYLYFSLPGKRNRWMVYLNLTLTMVIGGFWHGASWNFILWGALHGVALAFTRAWQSARGQAKPSSFWLARFGRRFATFHFVVFAWIFFRAMNLETAGQILARIGSGTIAAANIQPEFVLVLLIAVIAHYLPKGWYTRGLTLYTEAPFYAQAAAMAMLVIALQYVAQTGAAPFIYTRF